MSSFWIVHQDPASNLLIVTSFSTSLYAQSAISAMYHKDPNQVLSFHLALQPNYHDEIQKYLSKFFIVIILQNLILILHFCLIWYFMILAKSMRCWFLILTFNRRSVLWRDSSRKHSNISEFAKLNQLLQYIFYPLFLHLHYVQFDAKFLYTSHYTLITPRSICPWFDVTIWYYDVTKSTFWRSCSMSNDLATQPFKFSQMFIVYFCISRRVDYTYIATS